MLIGITGGAHHQKPVCIPFLLREGVCPRIGSCHLRHLQPEDDDARQLRVADVLGCIQPRALTGALASSSRDHILRLFDAWGDQFEQVHLGCVWNRLGGYLRDDSCRKDWLWEHSATVDRLVRKTIDVMPRSEARELSNMVHGAAVSKAAGLTPLYEEAARAALRILRNDREGFHEQEMVSLAWSFATAGHGAPELFDALAAEAERMMRGFSPQGLANLAWAFATAAHRTRSLFDAVAAEATPQLRSFTPQEVAMIAWAFAAADERNLAFVDKLIQRMAQPGPPFTSEQNRQMNPFVFWCVVELRLPEAQLPSQAMRTRCRENFASYSVSSMRAQQKGGLKDSVGRALRRLGLSPTADYIVADSLTLSYALLDERIAIEVDGPFQFVRSGAGAGKRPVGAKLLKRRQLQALGWTVLGVPFWEWDEVSKGHGSQEAGDCEAQVEYLRSRLQPVQEEAAERRQRRERAAAAEAARWAATGSCSVGQAGRVLPLPVQGRGRLQQGRRLPIRAPDAGGRGGAGAAVIDANPTPRGCLSEQGAHQAR